MRDLYSNLTIHPDSIVYYGSEENFEVEGQITNTSGDIENNSVIPSHFTQMSKNAIISVITYSFVFIVAAAGNFSVFFSVLNQLRRTKSRISLFILNLSIADLLVTFGVIPLEIVWRITIQWYGGNLLCKVCKVFSAFGLYLSSTVLICISLDRYFAIIHPLRLTDARRRGRIMLTIAWITAAVCSAPQSIIFNEEQHRDYPSVHQCVSILYSSKKVELIYNLFSVSMMYFLPLLVIIFTYGMIICKISRKSRQDGESRNDVGEASGRILLRRSDNRMERAKSRTLRLTFVIVVVFVLCWTPYVVMTLWYMFDRESAEKVDGKVQDALFIMAVANSCVNPLVYGSFTRECRKSMINCCGQCSGDEEGRMRRDRQNRRRGNHKIMYSASRRSTTSFRLGSSTAVAGGPLPIATTPSERRSYSPAAALNNKHTIPPQTLRQLQEPPLDIRIAVPVTKIVNNQLVIPFPSPFPLAEIKVLSSNGETGNTLNHNNSVTKSNHKDSHLTREQPNEFLEMTDLQVQS